MLTQDAVRAKKHSEYKVVSYHLEMRFTWNRLYFTSHNMYSVVLRYTRSAAWFCEMGWHECIFCRTLILCFCVQVLVCLTQPCTAPKTESMRVSPQSVTAFIHYQQIQTHFISSAPKSLFYWKGISHPKDTIEDLDMPFINRVQKLNVFEDKRNTKHLKCELNIYWIVWTPRPQILSDPQTIEDGCV